MPASRLRLESGYSLFEQAIVFPILLLFILGAIDVSHVLHSYAALQAGVDAALRCSYPVDGKCLKTITDSREPVYAVTLQHGTTRYFSPLYDYSGTAEWLSLPEISIPSITATVLSSVSYSASNREYFAQKPYFASTASYEYWIRQAQFPAVSGDARDNPVFSFRGDGPSAPMKHSLSQSLAGISLSTAAGSKNSASITFSLPSPLTAANGILNGETASASALCFASSTSEKNPANGHNADFASPCSISGNPSSRLSGTKELSSEGYISLYIEGLARSGDAATLGNISVQVTDLRGNKIVDLGGRVIGGSVAAVSGNLVPRGVPKNWVDPASTISKSTGLPYSEFDTYAHIKLPYDKNLKLSFTISRSAGKSWLRWDGVKVRFWSPQYQFVRGRVACTGGLARDDFDSVAQCKLDAKSVRYNKQVIVSVKTDTPETKVRTENVALGLCSRDYLVKEVQSNFSKLLESKSLGSPKNFESTPISQASAACPGIAPTTEHCPSNFGVPLKNGIPDPVAAVTTCSPSRLKDLQLYKEARDVGLAWKEKTVTLAKNLAWKPTDCNSLSLPPSLAPKDLQKYQRLNLRPEQKYESGTSVFTFPVSTKRYLEQHQELQCPEVKSSRKVFDDEISDPQLTTNSLFAGLHPALGCNAESTLRTEAIRLGMNPLAYLDTSTSSPKSWSEIPGKPNDSCSVYTTDFVADAQNPEFLGKYSASEIPEACLQAGAHCEQELTGLGSGEVGATGIDLERAAKVEGFSAVQAMMPRAKLDCSGPNCVQIQVLQQGDTILAQASTKLSPLLLWGNNVPLSYQDQRKSELTFAR